jgi:hypothetical protein
VVFTCNEVATCSNNSSIRLTNSTRRAWGQGSLLISRHFGHVPWQSLVANADPNQGAAWAACTPLLPYSSWSTCYCNCTFLPQSNMMRSLCKADVDFFSSGCKITISWLISGQSIHDLRSMCYNLTGTRLSSLALTASLKAAQLSANLLLFQTSVVSISTRILIQNALQRYNNGNNTDANWVRSISDLEGALSGGGRNALLLQGIIYPKNDTGIGNVHGLINVTGDGLAGTIPLPIKYPNGSQVYFGDPGPGFPPMLYPNLTFTYDRINSTYNQSNAFLNNKPLYSNSTIFLGPYQVNATFAMVSLTVVINNNTSR